MGARSWTWAIVLVALGAAGSVAVSQCVTPPSGLISWWTADGDGDDFAGPNDGALVGGTSIGPGVVDGAFVFDGVDGYVDAGDDASVRRGFPFSIDLWLRVDAADWFYAVACGDTAGNGIYSGYRVVVTPSGGVMTAIGSDFGCCQSRFRRNFFSPDGVIQIGTWHHVAAVFVTATHHRIYVDGVEQTTTSSGDAIYMNYGEGYRFQLGRAYDPNTDTYFHAPGAVDEVELHTGAMDASEIASIFQAGADGKCRERDFGDAPDAPGNPGYPTLSGNDGAYHLLGSGLFMGSTVDAESNGQPDPSATGDNDDGVTIGMLFAGETESLALTASAPGIVDAWVDFGSDASWAEPTDRILDSVPVLAGLNALQFTVPPDTVASSTFARFRLSSLGGLTPSGPAPDGEVEDYQVEVAVLDFGDALGSSHETLRADDGARHVIVEGVHLGSSVDADLDGQPDADAAGDDLDGNDDDDGVQFVTEIIPGEEMTLEVDASTPGFFSLWIDVGDDGSWAELEDAIFSSVSIDSGVTMLTAPVPASAEPQSMTLARARFSTAAGLQWYGLALDGEVEDYLVLIGEDDPNAVGEPPARTLRLGQNIPNPFNPRTIIPFELDRPGNVRVAVYDLRGNLVRLLIDDFRPAGGHQLRWDGRDALGREVSSGTYFIQLRAHGATRITKAVLLR